MPRPRKPARLYYRKDERQWVIRDGSTQQRTGYGLGQRLEAEAALQEYLANREPPARGGPAHPGELTVGEVLARYANDKGREMAAPATLAYSIQGLTPFWADLTCDAVTGNTCRAYTRERAKPRTIISISKNGKETSRQVSAGAATVRRELGVLQAALNHAHAEALLIYPIKVTLPESGEIRDRWLTRPEVARLLRHAEPHVQRFILLSIYTGRRASAVLELIWPRVDLDDSVIRFKANERAETKKRRGRVKIARQLRGHLTRWKKYGGTHVISFRGKPVASIKHGLARAAERASIEGVTPHVLKHTAITWAVMGGVQLEDAAEYFDTTTETIRKHYWHHSPHHQDRALSIIERRK